jgi:ABC-type sugar transport system ATPase subunit
LTVPIFFLGSWERAQVLPGQQFFELCERELLERVGRVFLLILMAIEIRGLAKTFGATVPVLAGIDLDVADGELLVLVGPSGSGKTTMLRLISGLDQPTGGKICLAGRDLAGVPPHKRNVALVFQDLALYGHLSVAENLAFGAPPGEPGLKGIREAAAMLGIDHLLKRYPAELSGGEQQRVALGRAIVRKPAALLLDEPLSSLDAPVRRGLRRELKRIQRELGVPTIYVTHSSEEAMALADRIAVLAHGRLVQVGTPDAIYSRPATAFVGNFFGSQGMNVLEGRLMTQEQATTFCSGKWTINLAGYAPRIATEKIACGFRPDALLPGIGDLAGRVTAVERLGEAIYVQVELAPVAGEAPQFAVARQRNLDMTPPRPGTVIPLSIDTSHLHWFDPQTGQRL